VRLVRLSGRSVLARRRPGAVVGLWAWETALGVVLGSAFSSVASGAYGRHPDGDAPLFAPGGLQLLDLARHSFAARGPLLGELLVVVALARLLGLLPSAAVFAELLFTTRELRAPRLKEALALGVTAFPTSFTLELFTLAAQGAVVAFGVAVGAMASSSATASLGERRGDLVVVGIALATLAGATIVGVVGDLARAAVVRWDAGAVVAGGRALERFLAQPVSFIWSYGWRGAASWVPVALGAWVAGHIGGGGGVALVVLAAFHQLVAMARVAIRVSWLARVLRGI